MIMMSSPSRSASSMAFFPGQAMSVRHHQCGCRFAAQHDRCQPGVGPARDAHVEMAGAELGEDLGASEPPELHLDAGQFVRCGARELAHKIARAGTKGYDNRRRAALAGRPRILETSDRILRA